MSTMEKLRADLLQHGSCFTARHIRNLDERIKFLKERIHAAGVDELDYMAELVGAWDVHLPSLSARHAHGKSDTERSDRDKP